MAADAVPDNAALSCRQHVALTFDAILAMIDHSPDTVLAYWRGYQWPTRYWHGPNGFRYWTTPGFAPTSGGEPIRDWVGCPWEPQGDGPRIYERVESLEGWWPTAAALAAGYRPCRSCQRRTSDSWSPEQRRRLRLEG